MEDEKYDEIKLMINSPLISQINSQMIGSFYDFWGIFLGNSKLIKKSKAIDSDSNFKISTLHILIDNIIFIYNNEYTNEGLEELISKIEDNYRDNQIIGVFSCKAFSYPIMSLKGQKYYLKAKNIIKKKHPNNYPFFFGVFSQNENLGDINYISFCSKIYYLNDKTQKFLSLPFETISLKETTYVTSINPISNKFIQYPYKETFENEVNKLGKALNVHLNYLNGSGLEDIKNIKKQLKTEIEQYVLLSEKMKKYSK